jgi:putative transposase
MGKRHKPEEIIGKLRQVEVMTCQGTSMADAIRSIGVTEVTYYRWRSEYGGMKLDQVKRLKELEVENGRLRKVGPNGSCHACAHEEPIQRAPFDLAPHLRQQLKI